MYVVFGNIWDFRDLLKILDYSFEKKKIYIIYIDVIKFIVLLYAFII